MKVTRKLSFAQKEERFATPLGSACSAVMDISDQILVQLPITEHEGETQMLSNIQITEWAKTEN